MEYIRAYIAQYGYAPAQHEMCAFMGWRSLATANEMVGELVKRGYVTMRYNRRRAITLVGTQ